MPFEDRNGMITGYKIDVKERKSKIWHKPLYASENQWSYEKFGLKYWTVYDIKISAMTSIGAGAKSDTFQIKTDEESK